jgi:hypothetical protein
VDGTRRRTFPYELLRCKIRCNREDTERQTKDDELEKYSLAVDGPVKGGRNASVWTASHPSSMDCPETCAETPFALILCQMCVRPSLVVVVEGVGPTWPKQRGACERQLAKTNQKLCQSLLKQRRGYTSRHAHGRTTSTFFRIGHDGKSPAVTKPWTMHTISCFQERQRPVFTHQQFRVLPPLRLDHKRVPRRTL